MKLIKPNINLKEEYLAMLEEWESTEEEKVPFSLQYDTSNFEEFLKMNKAFETKPKEGFVCHTTFWLVNDKNQLIGVSNIRHELNDDLRIKNGHIGYGIRPSFRRKGYATKILALSLEKAKYLGVKKALLTCNKSNIGSQKVITNNGGILRREEIVNGENLISFWIAVT